MRGSGGDISDYFAKGPLSRMYATPAERCCGAVHFRWSERATLRIYRIPELLQDAQPPRRSVVGECRVVVTLAALY